jgi:hypothetical protein
MTTEQKFPYHACTWHHSDETSERWLSALEKTGAENVRARLARFEHSSHASIAIGTEPNMTAGFAQEWLAWRDQQKSAEQTARLTGKSSGPGLPPSRRASPGSAPRSAGDGRYCSSLEGRRLRGTPD